MTTPAPLSIVMLGATGAVGGQAVQTLVTLPQVERLTLLGRRPVADLSSDAVQQHKIDIFDPASYLARLPGHESAICTLGVGEPSKMSKDDFIKIDKTAVLDFASACKQTGVRHFEVLGSVGTSATSRSFYLRTKGELVDELRALEFERLSVFQPSMILTPSNRYGVAQAITLRVWPLLKPMLFGRMRKYRGIQVAQLGEAMARNLLADATGVELLVWDDFLALCQ